MSNLTININDKTYYLEKSFIFSGGEIQIQLPSSLIKPNGLPGSNRKYIYIKTVLDSADAIMELVLTHDALDRRFPEEKFCLIIDYFPYARQDRPCVVGEAFSLEVMCNLINSLGFEKVYISDPHSSVTTDLLLNVVVTKQYQHFADIIRIHDIDIDSCTLVSPDAGALPKMNKIAEYYGKTSVNAYKVRCPNSGQIIETKIDIDDFYGKDIIICDDIADNGMTFYFLAKLLKEKNCGKIILYVTHAIFPNGADKLFEYIDEIYTTNSIYKSADPRIHVLSI